MAITPFIEAPTKRTTTQPTSGGMDTRAFDFLRQGASVINDEQRFNGTLPKMGPEIDSSVHVFNQYGQPKLYLDSAQWEEIGGFDPVIWINASEMVFPSETQSTIIARGDFFDGVLEPFELSARDPDDPVGDTPLHNIKVHIAEGNVDNFGKTDQISQFYEYPTNMEGNLTPVYVDSSDRIGTEGGEVLLPGSVTANENSIVPFTEVDYSNDTYGGLSITLAKEQMVNAIAQMSGATAGYIPTPQRTHSMPTGFTYDKMASPFGVDSIAYGGLLRSGTV